MTPFVPDIAGIVLIVCLAVLLVLLIANRPRRPRRKVWRHYGIAVIALGALTGCASPLFTPRLVPVASVQTVPVEQVTKTTTTDSATGQTSVVYVTNVVSQVVTNWATNTVYEVNETVTRSLAAVGSLNATVAEIAPNPASGTLSLLLGGVAGIFGWMARVKTKAAQRAQEEAEDHREGAVKANDLLQTVIVGVEEANVPAVKEAIAKISRQWGNSQELHAAVKRQTAS